MGSWNRICHRGTDFRLGAAGIAAKEASQTLGKEGLNRFGRMALKSFEKKVARSTRKRLAIAAAFGAAENVVVDTGHRLINHQKVTIGGVMGSVASGAIFGGISEFIPDVLKKLGKTKIGKKVRNAAGGLKTKGNTASYAKTLDEYVVVGYGTATIDGQTVITEIVEPRKLVSTVNQLPAVIEGNYPSLKMGAMLSGVVERGNYRRLIACQSGYGKSSGNFTEGSTGSDLDGIRIIKKICRYNIRIEWRFSPKVS